MEWGPAQIRALRAALRLSQEKFAFQLGAAPRTVRNWEAGRHPPSIALKRELDDALESVSLEQEKRFLASLAALEDTQPFVRIPQKSATVPFSRRELLTALGIGALGGALLAALERALVGVRPTREMFADLRSALDDVQAAARTTAPARLIDEATVQVSVLEVLRRRTPDGGFQRELRILQSRYAESLSWMHEEAGDLDDAVYWTDRAAHWAQTAGWIPMIAYAFVRRSMMSVSFAGDGLRAVENAQCVLRMPGAPAYVRGLAAKQMCFGYALVGRADDSARALELTTRLLGEERQESEEPVLGQRSVVGEDLLAIFQATCDIYLGRGESAIGVLEPRLASIATRSLRTYAITRAKLAHAYASAAEPGRACFLILETLYAADELGSLSTRNELRRALPVLADWSDRSDVQEVLHRLANYGR